MNKKIFDRMFHTVASRPVNSYRKEELRSLAAFYQAIHFLISTLQWLEEQYGPRKKIEERMKEIEQTLFTELDTLSPAGQAGNLNTLFELSAMLNDSQTEDQVTEKAFRLLEKLERKETTKEETDYCLLAANLYYQLREEEYQNIAIHLIDKWIEEVPQASRLLAIDSYQALTLDNRYQKYLENIPLICPQDTSCQEYFQWAQWILCRYPFSDLEAIENRVAFYIAGTERNDTLLQLNGLTLLASYMHRQLEKECWKEAL